MTTRDDDETVPYTVRLPKGLLAWLEGKRSSLRESQGLDVSVQTVIKQQLERAKRIDDDPQPGPKGPKKARTAT